MDKQNSRDNKQRKPDGQPDSADKPENQNQQHNAKKVSLGPNTKR